MNGTNRDSQRIFSLDLLRLVCMLMIVCGHAFGYGAAHVLPSGLSASGVLSSAVATFFGISVNCFVLISGYFSSQQRFRLSRLLRLGTEILFYSWAILLFHILRSGALPPMKDLLTMVFPISFNHFWFVSAYFGLSLLSPVLNWALGAMTQKQHAATLCILLLTFSLWSDVIPRANPFGAGSGYCLTWFVVLYVIAAYLRRYVPRQKLRSGKLLALYAVMCLCVFALNTLMALLSGPLPFLATYEMDSFFSRYNCLLIVVASVSFFGAFLAMDLPERRSIAAASRLTLGVYLLHGGPYTSTAIWAQVFALFGIGGDLLYVPVVILASAALFLVCLGLEWLRSCCFRLWEGSAWYARTMQRLDSAVERWGERICEKITEF